MISSFVVSEDFPQPPDVVWRRLTDLEHASDWMTGVSGLRQVSAEPLGLGSTLRFEARGGSHETRITEFVPKRKIALTSTQGGVTATYLYELEPSGSGTRATLDARCEASGWWRLIHPLIGLGMKWSDGGQLARLKTAMMKSSRD